MRLETGITPLWSWIAGLALVLCLSGCPLPRAYEPPPAHLPPAPAPPPVVSRPIFYVNANRLNLRACPGMDCPKISVLERNEEVEKLGQTDDWSQIRVKRDGRLGWVNTRYLSAQPIPEAAPTPPAPAPVTPPPTEKAEPAPAPTPEKTPEAQPPAEEKPKTTPPAKKKAEERPAKPPKGAKAAEPPPKKTAPEKTAPPAEKPKEPTPEQPKGIRIM